MNAEKIPVSIFADAKDASVAVAGRIAQLIKENADKGRPTVLGLATGHTPVNVYAELIRLHKNEGLDLSNVITFSLDEYWPIEPERIQSYHFWMHENLFKHINIRPENVHIPRGDIPGGDIESRCRNYERDIEVAGGIDLQILGIGRSGHIGFNEPGSPRDSRTRRIHLDGITLKDAAGDFFGEENVPQMAITMGVGTVLEAKEICLLAFGEHKANIARRSVEGQISSNIAASFLQEHPNATIYLDVDAAAELTRIATPWLLGPCAWDELLERRAVIWLSQKVKKPILKLTNENYGENGLFDLLQKRGKAYDINVRVFRRMMSTITGWPGGKESTKKFLVLSPHPDDDVICMGGTLARLAAHGHEVHAAYMVSGSLSVFDHNVLRHAEFVKEFNSIFSLTPGQTSRIEQDIEKLLKNKKPGETDTPEIQGIKALIRRTEAIAAARHCGLADERIHFLDLPFYHSGRVQKLSIGPEDISLIHNLLTEIRPDAIFAAGDMSDPHGTHRLCLEAFLQAYEQYSKERALNPEIWLYRGAWQEWAPEQIDMAVPLSPDEQMRKRLAIFRHESQKDRAMFPGPYDSSEFWQRAEDRNHSTARIYDALGLPEYNALEAFAHYPVGLAVHIQNQLTSTTRVADPPARADR